MKGKRHHSGMTQERDHLLRSLLRLREWLKGYTAGSRGSSEARLAKDVLVKVDAILGGL